MKWIFINSKTLHIQLEAPGNLLEITSAVCYDTLFMLKLIVKVSLFDEIRDVLIVDTSL